VVVLDKGLVPVIFSGDAWYFIFFKNIF
jgi:hypothetical protein